jgi:hypothetical protein
MSQRICRDCGVEMSLQSRGCTNCALNLEAENMIEKVVWRRIFPLLVILVAFIGAVLIYRW